MQFGGAINFTYVDHHLSKYRGLAETTGHYHSCPYLGEEDIEVTSQDNYEVIKKEDKAVSSDKEPLSLIAEELFEKYKPPTQMSISQMDATICR